MVKPNLKDIHKDVKKRKARFGFTTEKDITLLKAAVVHNPWQLGEKNWQEIVQTFCETYKNSVTVRTAKARINLLVKKHEHQNMPNNQKSGTEEEISELGFLLNEIQSYIAESEASINSVVGPDVSSKEEENPVFTSTEVECKLAEPPTNTLTTSRFERNEADKERALLLENAPEPNAMRRKRKFNVEDQMIEKKQEHEMSMDIQKLELEKSKLNLEEMREARLAEEGRRKDELAKIQLEFQNQLMAVMIKIVEK